jgi:hypothetical protein
MASQARSHIPEEFGESAEKITGVPASFIPKL